MSFSALSNKSVAAFYTLGCKLNQLESEAIAAAFSKEGFTVIPWNENQRLQDKSIISKPDVLIINTCTVTSKSEQKARRIIRRALRDLSLKLIIVTGCYAQMEAEALESLDMQFSDVKPLDCMAPSLYKKRLYIVNQDYKHLLLKLPQDLRSGNYGFFKESLLSLCVSGSADSMCKDRIIPAETSFLYEPDQFNFHSRAFVKIQDGCDNNCSYCRTSIARGNSRSLEAQKVLAVIKSLEDKGHEEAVLTGVNISQYSDKTACSSLAFLLEYLVSGTSKIRLRLSSIEPYVIDNNFVHAVSHNRIRPHFHISMQSGSRALLERMKRFYDPVKVLEDINFLRTVKDDPFTGCDIIVGFPGETPDDFERTLDFCSKAGFAGIHVFPFSLRPGTETWNMAKDCTMEHGPIARVTEKEAGLRANKISSLALNQKKAYIERWIGREIEAIIEEDTVRLSDFVPAMSANYLRLLVKTINTQELKPGKAYNCRIVSGIDSNSNIPKAKGYDAVAEII